MPDLSEALQAAATERATSKCWFARLSTQDQNVLIPWLEGDLSTRAIAKALKNAGIDIGESGVGKHRMKGCGCFR